MFSKKVITEGTVRRMTNSMGHVLSVKTVLHSSLKMEGEEIVPLGPLSSATSRNFIQLPDSATSF